MASACSELASAPATQSFTPQTGQVRSITLPHFEPDLPVAAGRDEFLEVCVSCHSPRYVTMQPPFPQRQWEETVDKMAKVYGAAMASDQRQAIVRYLVATRGPQATSPGDEEPDFTAAARVQPASETAPLLEFATNATESAAELIRGAELFKQDCAACHGPAGRGDGQVGQVLWPTPENLAATRFSPRLLSRILWNGKRGSAMPAWRTLPTPDLAALAAYVESLHPPAESESREASPTVLEQGNKLFQLNCAPCHGASADGTGPAGANLLPEPANFHLKQPNSDYLLQVLREGRAGTAMPAWKNQLSESDLSALAAFVRSLFEESDPRHH